MYLIISKICALKYMNLISELWTWTFSSRISMKEALWKTKGELVPLTDIEVLIIVGKGISYSLYRFLKANTKYIEEYDKNTDFVMSSISGC